MREQNMDYRLLIFYSDRYIELPKREIILLKEDLSYAHDESQIKYKIENRADNILINGEEVKPGEKRKIENLVFMTVKNISRSYTTRGNDVIKIGSSPSDHIVVNNNMEMAIRNNKLIIFSGACYINGKLINVGEYDLEKGDTLLIDTVKIIVKANNIQCVGEGYSSQLKKEITKLESDGMEDFPEYKRSPRIIKPISENNIEVLPPPEKEVARKGQLLKTILPPLIMMVLTLVTGMILGRGIYMMVMAAGMLVTVIFSITTYFSDKKDRKEKEKLRKEKYTEYLLAQRKKLNSVKIREEEARRFNAPDLKEIEELISDYSSRIYERTANDDDFLSLSLGIADVEPAYRLSFRKDELSIKEDEMRDEAETVIQGFRTIDDMPQTVDLKQSHLGIVGEKNYIHVQLKSIISQLCFSHSYHDIEIITLTDAKNFNEFRWTKWYPHCTVKTINVSGIIYGENQRDQVLGNITQILKERKMKMEEEKKENLYLPHYIFIIDNPKLIINHSIMEYLQRADSKLGFSIIYTTNMKANLPENIKTILSVDGRDRGTILMENGNLRNKSIQTPQIDEIDFEQMARKLAPLKHSTGVSTQIPESITFFGLFNVKKPEELPISELWENSNSAKSLAVPLGLRGKDDVVELNLHEKAHGPHGLVAGTTGSGKSEILQSYILSLAIHFHPHEVGFLLIDYKGGGMANLFKDLPHLLGTITNLDGSESMRALASIKSELARRQRIFNDHDVNNINQYTKLFKKGEAQIPLPHLFLISDEFAELKKEQPDFMTELVSAARIGRSLGVHLILATQKPSGVVDDQIWSNSKFKLALKVQNESDSKEVLKTPDAASITVPGRAYLQVGNNEIYELFQSAWSGADFSEDEVEKGFDNRIYRINDLGQGELLNGDLSETVAKAESKHSQLDVVVDEIKRIYDNLNPLDVEKPWLPSLSTDIVNPHLSAPNNSDADDYNLATAVGMVDIPEAQKQEEYIHDFTNDGNFAVFGASGFGKSTTIMNMALDLANRNSAANLHYYIMDFGNSSLVQLKNLTHTADYFTYDEEEKLEKLMALILDEISKRKQLFARESAINFKMYNKVADEKLPVIAIFVDNYDVIKEMEIELSPFFVKLTRDGPGIGIYTIISASNDSMVRYAVLNNFKNKISHFMFDQMDIRAITGRSNYELPEKKGRAMVKMEEVNVMQVYLPVEYEDDVSYTERISEKIAKISEVNNEYKVKGIPMLPEVVSILDIKPDENQDKYHVPIGLDSHEVNIQSINLRDNLQVVIGGPKTGKTSLLKLIIAQTPGIPKFVFDTPAGDLEDTGDPMSVFLKDSDEAEEFLESLKSFIGDREDQYAQEGNGIRPRDFYSRLEPAILLVDNGEKMIDVCKDIESEMGDTLKRFLAVGGSIITTAQPRFRGRDDITSILCEAVTGMVLGNPRDQTDFDITVDRNTKAVKDIGYLCGGNEPIKVKLPLV